MVQNLEYYKVFYHVARCGSLTLAAQELSISQPAVSQSVKLLETSVGVKLFVRSAKGVKLTKEGELLYSYVAGGYEQIEMGEKKLKQMMDLELEAEIARTTGFKVTDHEVKLYGYCKECGGNLIEKNKTSE